VTAAWRQSALGYKLEDQWDQFAGDLPWTWKEIRSLQPRAVGLALLDAGQLEMGPRDRDTARRLPVAPPAGTPRSHRGVRYAIVTRGAADGDADPGRRPGLAWARMGDRLVLATSERAMRLTIDEAQAGRGITPPLPGLVSMELNLTTLRSDRYFRREFVFPAGPEAGKLRAALRLEDGSWSRCGKGRRASRQRLRVRGTRCGPPQAGNPKGVRSGRHSAPRSSNPSPNRPRSRFRPGAAPAVGTKAPEDRYAVNFTRPLVVPGAPPWKRVMWRDGRRCSIANASRAGATGWEATGSGWWSSRFPRGVTRSSSTSVGQPWRAAPGRATLVAVGDTQEIRVGPGLVALAVKRTGGFVWVGPSAKDLALVPTPQAASDVVRWARVDLDGVRGEALVGQGRGPGAAGSVRPLSDRVLGLLGWIPATASLSVERRKTASGWSERVVFGTGCGRAGPRGRRGLRSGDGASMAPEPVEDKEAVCPVRSCHAAGHSTASPGRLMFGDEPFAWSRSG